MNVGSSTTLTPSTPNFGGLKKRVAAYVQGANLASVLSDAGEALNLAIDEINTDVWHWMNRQTTLALTAGTATVTLPADFKKPRACYKLNSSGSPQGRIYYQMPKQFENSEWEIASGAPDCYTVRNAANDLLMTFNYNPSSAFVASYPNVRMDYYARVQHFADDGDTLSDIGLNPEATNFLLWFAREELSATRAPDKLKAATQRRMEKWNSLRRDNNDEQTDWSHAQ